MTDTDEIEAIARSYAGSDFRMRRVISVDHLYVSSSEEWTIDEFEALLDDVPKDYRENARIQFERGWGDEGDTFKITYERPETDEEVAKRVSSALQYAEKKLQIERNQYENLKRKYQPRFVAYPGLDKLKMGE